MTLQRIVHKPTQKQHLGGRDNVSYFESITVREADFIINCFYLLNWVFFHHILTTVASTIGCDGRARTTPERCWGIPFGNYYYKQLVSLGIKNIATMTAGYKRVLQRLILSSLKKRKGFFKSCIKIFL